MNGDGVSSDPIWASWMRLTCFFFIIKSLKFDTSLDTDEDISYKLKYDSKKYYQFKESGFIKLGMQLKVSDARNAKLTLYKQVENINVDFY